jgi:hypothetical protein
MRLLTTRPNLLRHGYLYVCLKAQGRGIQYLVHRLVLEAFVGPRPPGMECRHFPDRNPANNRLENLSWGTRAENAQDRIRHGTHGRGERGVGATLRDSDVPAIHEAYRSGATPRELARQYGVGVWTIRRVLLGETYTLAQPLDKTVMRPGAVLRGADRPRAKVTEEQVRQIRRLHAEGWSIGQIAHKFALGKSTLGRIVHREAWAHVP